MTDPSKDGYPLLSTKPCDKAIEENRRGFIAIYDAPGPVQLFRMMSALAKEVRIAGCLLTTEIRASRSPGQVGVIGPQSVYVMDCFSEQFDSIPPGHAFPRYDCTLTTYQNSEIDPVDGTQEPVGPPIVEWTFTRQQPKPASPEEKANAN